jgi:hypothetical protein
MFNAKKNPASAATDTGSPENKSKELGNSMSTKIIARNADNSNDREIRAWADKILDVVNGHKHNLLGRDDYLAFEREQTQNLWDRNDCLAKVISAQIEEWPIPDPLPFWAASAKVELASYRELALSITRRLSRGRVTLEISQDAWIDLGEGSVAIGGRLFHIMNRLKTNDDLNEDQLRDVQALAGTALELFEQATAKPLVRRTAPGEPDLQGVGGGL